MHEATGSADAKARMRIGVDLGGTKTEAIALDLDGAVLARERVATPRDDYAATLRCLVDLVHGLERRLSRHGSVGLGIPGAISPATGLVKNANSTWLNGRPFDQDLASALRRPVRLDNDANCFALSEAVDGAAAGAGVVFGVILGTGVGGGLIVDGRPLGGRNAIGGEWGHNPLPWPRPEELPGPACYCGQRGCIETFLSGPGLQHDHRAAGGEDINAEALVARAADGEPHATSALDRYVDRLARGLASVINLVDPDVIVLGGGLSNLVRLYRDVPQRLDRYVFSDHVDTPIVPPTYGDSSGVRGAAWLWRTDELDRACATLDAAAGPAKAPP